MIVYYFDILNKKNRKLLVVELLAVTWVPSILRHPEWIAYFVKYLQRPQTIRLRWTFYTRNKRGVLRCVLAKVLDTDILKSEFELQSCCFLPFWTNTPGESMNLRIHRVGRLNGVVSLVTVIEELSNVTSPFWSCDKSNPKSLSFTNRTSEAADVVVRYSAASHIIPPLCFIDLSSCSSIALWLFYRLGGNWVPSCYVVLIPSSVLPTEYSVLGFSPLDILMHYKNQC